MGWWIFAGYVVAAFFMLRPAAIAFARWDFHKRPKDIYGDEWFPVILMAVLWPFPLLYWAAKFLFKGNLARFTAWYVLHEHVSRAQRRALREERAIKDAENRKRQLNLDLAAAEQRLRDVNAELGIKEDDLN